MSQQKEELIRQAAIRIFSRKGFYKTRAEEIAQAANVAVGTIYNYFENKEDILLSIFKTEFEERMRFYEELQKGGLPVPERIRRLLHGYFSLFQNKEELAQLLLRERFNPGKKFKGKLNELYRGMIERIEALISEGVEEGWIRQCNPRIMAHSLFAAVESISACGLLYPEEEAKGLLHAAPDELVSLMWKGLRREEGQ